MTTVPYPGKSKAKDTTAVSESRNVEKTTTATKAIKLGGARATQARGPTSESARNEEKPVARGRWKIAEIRKSLKSRDGSLATGKKTSRANERTASSFADRTRSAVVESPSSNVVGIASPAEETAATTTVDTTKIRPPPLTSRNAVDENSVVATTVEWTSSPDEAMSTVAYDDEARRKTTVATGASATDADVASTDAIATHTTEFPHEITLSPTVTTSASAHSTAAVMTTTTTTPEKLYPVYIPEEITKSYKNSPENTEKTAKSSSDASKGSFRPRYAKQQQQQAVDKMTVVTSMVTSRTVGPTSRYIRKKTGVFTPYDAAPRTPSTEATTLTQRREFRPRTATYRRHSEVPTSSSGVTQLPTVGITPKPTKYHASVRSSTPISTRSTPEPLVNVRIDATPPSTPSTPVTPVTPVTPSPASGIVDSSSNGASGTTSNIFNPTRSAFVTAANTTTLLEQLRSTVAPLLNSLGDKTPVFSGSYSNVDAGVSALYRFLLAEAESRFRFDMMISI